MFAGKRTARSNNAKKSNVASRRHSAIPNRRTLQPVLRCARQRAAPRADQRRSRQAVAGYTVVVRGQRGARVGVLASCSCAAVPWAGKRTARSNRAKKWTALFVHWLQAQSVVAKTTQGSAAVSSTHLGQGGGSSSSSERTGSACLPRFLGLLQRRVRTVRKNRAKKPNFASRQSFYE